MSSMVLLSLVPCVTNASPPYETALVTHMHMAHCMEPPRHGGFVTDSIVGPAPATPAGAAECPEYEIEGARVSYRIRPRRDVLLPVGDEVHFRLHKRDLLILTDDASKELVFSVVEMTLKSKHPAPELVADQNKEQHSRKCLTMEREVVPCGGK